MRLDELPTNDEWQEFDWAMCFTDSCDEYTRGVEVREARPNGDLLTERAITPGDVESIADWHGYSPEGGGSVSLVAICRLTSGEWASVSAWADYTGWGCQDGVTWSIAATREDVERWGLSEYDRDALTLSMPLGHRNEDEK